MMRDMLMMAAIETMPAGRRPVVLEGDVPPTRRIYLCAAPRATDALRDALVASGVPHAVDRDPSSPLRGVKYTSAAFARMLGGSLSAYLDPAAREEAVARGLAAKREAAFVAEAARLACAAIRGGRPLTGEVPPPDDLAKQRLAAISAAEQPVAAPAERARALSTGRHVDSGQEIR